MLTQKQTPRTVLSLVNFCARFIPNLATIHVAERLSYDPDADMQVIVDSSPVGTGVVLTQKQSNGVLKQLGPLHKLSTQQCGATLIVVVWGYERLHVYLYG